MRILLLGKTLICRFQLQCTLLATLDELEARRCTPCLETLKKERLKRMRREPHYTSGFVADLISPCEVSINPIHVVASLQVTIGRARTANSTAKTSKNSPSKHQDQVSRIQVK
ncbi:hypothetical protein VNO77_19956 [Canavalia gladiata]|uniref:Uncharacterized protein n=1 Tax=Canavalia gladiata TaxID=3824 RepID=A0AAN9LSA2_CANGL